MGAADRTVQHLHLRAPSAQAAVQAVQRLEDALRCASLPDAGERVLLVRRLHLGRLPEGLSSQSLSLLIEQRVTAVGGEWVHGGDERAAQVDMVFFEGRWQAASIALDRRARGAPLSAWYWRSALPGVPLQADPNDFVATLWQCLEQEGGASASRSAFVADVVARRQGDWLVHHLFRPGRSDGSAVQVRAFDDVSMNDLRSGDVHVHYGHPHHVDVPRSWPAVVHAHLRDAGWRTRGEVDQEVYGARSHSENQPASEAGAHVGSASASLTPRAPRVDESSPQVVELAGATSVGGLLFLLPLLVGLGFAAWQEQHAGQPLCRLILREALHRLRVRDSDPCWSLVDSLPGAAAPRSCNEVADEWLDACRRHLYRTERLSLQRVCWRPALLRWSATHLHVQMDLQHADIRVRRQGLDIDPGWLPWLGRVVTFGYQSRRVP